MRTSGKAALRVGLLSTVDTNIGDDLIREGIIRILGAAWPGRDLELAIVNKHDPSSVYPEWHPVRLTRRLRRGRTRVEPPMRRLTHALGFSRFDGCDLVVQCGTPVLWPGCHRSEWAVPIWREVIGRIHERTPVANLAAGSCFPWERQPDGPWDDIDASFVREMLSYSRVTTARDRLASRLYRSHGGGAPLLPCAALLAGEQVATGHPLHAPRGARPRLLLNYMPGGGHYDWDQHIDPATWRDLVRRFVQRAASRFDVAFLCHSEAERREAIAISPTNPCLVPRSPAEYFEAVRGFDVAVCNRLHASVALAGVGIPSLAVGTDTRLLMVDALGLPVRYVKEATGDWLDGALERLLERHGEERERLLALREETWVAYRDVLRATR